MLHWSSTPRIGSNMCSSIVSLEPEHDAEMAHAAEAVFLELLFSVTHSFQTHFSKIRSTVVKA